ncbi:MAG: YihY/virulence factor BrkB family protein [Phenylobacterium sp.]|nr:YihY/virulence factor BrkB family protein [Phenylobacterium sp.]
MSITSEGGGRTSRPRSPSRTAGRPGRTLPTPESFEAREPGRGRLATSPRRIPLRGWSDILWRTWQETNADRLTVVAGSVTYYTLLAIFPAIGVFVSLYGLFADVGEVQKQLAQLSAVFPPAVVGLIGEQMVRLATGDAGGLSLAFLVSLLLSLWSASAGMRSLFDGLNIAYDEVERRSFLARAAVTYGFTLALVLFLIVISGILVAAPLALAAVGLAEDWLIAIRWPLVYLLASAAFSVAYRYGPSRERARWRWLTLGAAVAAALWMVGSAGFSWYVNNIAGLDRTYGPLGAVIAFMIWIWFSVIVVLVGAELNAEIEHQTALDSTTGPAEPIGERGATMADTVGVRFGGLRGLLGGLLGRVKRR